MNEFSLNEYVEKLTSAFLNIIHSKPEERLISANSSQLSDVKDILNNIFPENQCINILYTLNTDKQFFGIHVDPVISSTDSITIFATDEKMKLSKYYLEIDSKLFDVGLDGIELTALVLYEISSMMDSYEAIDNVRALIDLHVLSADDVFDIRNSTYFTQLITFAIKDTLYKVTSSMFKEDPEDLVCNKLIQTVNLEESLISAQERIINSSYGVGESLREPKTIILKWVFMVYKDITHNSRIIRDTLKDSKLFTASRLRIGEIDRTIDAVDNVRNMVSTDIKENATLQKVIESRNMYSLLEISLFKSLKQNGLRGIEDALYEYSMRIKNCDTEEDAMYILRCINTRLSILEDYIYNTPDISEVEKKHWMEVATKYRELREILAKKKIVNKKQYGLFFDYDQLDYLDQNNNQ